MDGDLSNTLTGSPTGPVVQAGSITGDVHLHLSTTPPPISQLPPAIPGFVGRAAELAVLTAQLDRGTPITCVTGSAGIGKTALAVHWAHRSRDRFPDGQLYVDLRGFGPDDPLSPAAAVRALLDAFQVSRETLPVTVDAQAALFRGLVQDKRVLVLLDNARDADHVRPLLPGSPTCAVLITSRDRLPSLVAREQARPIVLDLPSRAESRDILAAHIGADRVHDESRAVDELVERCARLPIALAIAGARAVTEPHLPLDDLATELAELATGDSEHTDIRAVFTASHRVLPPDAARLFRLLGAHPGPDIGTHAAASLAGTPPEQTRARLATLVRSSLLTEYAAGRFRTHDLLREYAAERARDEEPPAERTAAVERLLDHYLHTARAGERLLYPSRFPIPFDPPAPGVAPVPLADRVAALAWFTTEHTNLLAALDLARRHGFTGHAWRLPWTMSSYFGWRGHWRDWETTQEVAREAAVRHGAPEWKVVPLRVLGRIHTLNHRHQAAIDAFTAALRIPTDAEGRAHTHHLISFAYLRMRRLDDALRHARRAVDLARDAEQPVREARARLQLGRALSALGNHREGLAQCRRAARVLLDHDDMLHLAGAMSGVGKSLLELGDPGSAIRHFEVVALLNREFGDVWSLAWTLCRIGDAHAALGDLSAAQRSWTEADGLMTDIHHSDAEQIRLRIATSREGG
ncbi:NB-ARC domain-containing protein [Saccharothrix sp.]|uniref:ATP-binding protein n=1 Tax=Saccharothrix sp. TaxID=1873460 RepID=UPI00281242F7|nr:NB-ARC domain-containing protein [Saccharothrix sp.]